VWLPAVWPYRKVALLRRLVQPALERSGFCPRCLFGRCLELLKCSLESFSTSAQFGFEFVSLGLCNLKPFFGEPKTRLDVSELRLYVSALVEPSEEKAER